CARAHPSGRAGCLTEALGHCRQAAGLGGFGEIVAVPHDRAGRTRATSTIPPNPPGAGLPAAELESRRERLLEHVRRERLTGYVLFDADYIRYFTAFNFLSTERPVVVVQSSAGEMAVFAPEFEVERVRAETTFERVESYPEYPGIEHPMRV